MRFRFDPLIFKQAIKPQKDPMNIQIQSHAPDRLDWQT